MRSVRVGSGLNNLFSFGPKNDLTPRVCSKSALDMRAPIDDTRKELDWNNLSD